MGIDNINIIAGSFSILLLIVIRVIKLRKKIFNYLNLLTSLGYAIFAYTSSLVLVNMINLAINTYQNRLTVELITANKPYIFLAWLIFGLSAFVALIKLITDVSERDTVIKSNQYGILKEGKAVKVDDLEFFSRSKEILKDLEENSNATAEITKKWKTQK